MQLDQGHFQDCLSRQDSYVNLENGGHVFSVAVNSSSGASAVSQFRWTVGEQMLTFNSMIQRDFLVVIPVCGFGLLSSKSCSVHELCCELQI